MYVASHAKVVRAVAAGTGNMGVMERCLPQPAARFGGYYGKDLPFEQGKKQGMDQSRADTWPSTSINADNRPIAGDYQRVSLSNF
jgi:hypothetical protein